MCLFFLPKNIALESKPMWYETSFSDIIVKLEKYFNMSPLRRLVEC